MNDGIGNQMLPHPDKIRQNITDGTARNISIRTRHILTLAIEEAVGICCSSWLSITSGVIDPTHSLKSGLCLASGMHEMRWRRHSDYCGNQIFGKETERRFQGWVSISPQSGFVEDVASVLYSISYLMANTSAWWLSPACGKRDLWFSRYLKETCPSNNLIRLGPMFSSCRSRRRNSASTSVEAPALLHKV